MNLSTRVKLLLSFGIIWLMLLVVILIAYRGFQDIIKSENALHKVNFRIALELKELKSNIIFNRASVLDMMMTKNGAEQIVIESNINEKSHSIDTIIESLSILTSNQIFQNKLKDLKNVIDKYRDSRKEEIKLVEAGKLDEAQILGTTSQKDRFEKIQTLTNELATKAAKDADDQLLADIKEAWVTTFLFVVFGIAMFLLSLLLVLILNRTIALPLKNISSTAVRISEGELNIEMDKVERKDEVGILIQSFQRMKDTLMNIASAGQKIASGDLTLTIVPQSDKDVLGNILLQMLNNLRSMTKDILEGVNSIAASSSEILAATTQVATGAAETASAITETTATVEEVRQAAQLSNQKATRVAENAQQVSQVTQIGQNVVNESIKGMNDIQIQMKSVSNTIISLSEQSQQIGGIISSVTDVADQSNLLAVNASIEAAKAGEQGKGFAVVALEIKNLAQQSKQATIEVRNILSDIQKATSAAVMATEQTTKSIENGMKQSTEAGEAIKKLGESSSKAIEAATQIVASSHQQVIGMDQIGLAMQNINQAGTENAASMLQAEKATRSLAELGQKLKILVSKYKI